MVSSPPLRLFVRTFIGLYAAVVLGATPAASQTIRVLQWNTYHGGYGTDGIYDQDRQVAWMRSVAPDIISLNEVKASQAAAYKTKLEAATGTIWHSFHVNAQSDGTGNQILSRFPILRTSIYRMATNGQYARAVAQATIDVQGRSLNFFSTHLDHADQTIRRAQVAELTQFLSGFSDPRIVAGDFNAAPASGEITTITADWIDGWEHTVHVGAASAYPPDNAADLGTRTLRERIDYIFLSERSGLIVRAAEKPDTRDLANPNVTRLLGTTDDRGVRPSDHNLFVAAVDLGPPPPDDDDVPPVVSLLEPAAGSDLSDVLVARANAVDDVLLAKVQFIVDGQIVGTDRWVPFELTIGTNQLALGTHTIEAVAIDAAGNRGSSGPRQFTVGADLSSADEIVLYAAAAPVRAGGWGLVSDTSAAAGAQLHHPNAGAAKITTPLANPVNFFEMLFDASAGQPYRIWMRLRAQNNHYNNDSVHVQFDNTVTSSGAPIFRIGTTSAAEINLEDCSGCGLSGWGWQDNGWGVGVLGPELRFATHGPQRIRVQTREDGVSIDQIVVSASRYRSTSPGALQNDTTILQNSAPPPDNQPPLVSLTAPAASASFVAPAAITVTASASDTDGAISRVEFLAGGSVIGMSTTAPYSIAWTGVAAGTYQLTARALDDDGALTTSQAVTINVTGPANQPPVVSLTAPAASASFVAPATITVTASANDSDGAITRVEFLAGGTVIGTSTTAPYSIAWTGVAAGTYQLTARAVDDRGAVTTSAAVAVSVTPAPAQIVLTARTIRLKSQKAVDLAWSGVTASTFAVFRDNQLIATVTNGTTYRDMLGKPRTVTYRVCVSGTQTCSNSVTVSF